MNIVFAADAERQVRGWRQEEDYSISLVSANDAVGEAGAITPTVKDLVYAARTAVVTTVKSDVVVSTPLQNPSVSLSSATPDICSVNQSGLVTRVADGTCRITAHGQTGDREISQYIYTDGVSVIYDDVTSIVPGTLRAYLLAQQVAALSGVTPGGDAQRSALNGDGSGGVNIAHFLYAPNAAQLAAGYEPLPQDLLAELFVSPQSPGVWRAWISPHHYIAWGGHTTAVGSAALGWIRFADEGVVRYSAAAWEGNLCRLLPADWRLYAPESLMTFLNEELYCWTKLRNTYVAGEYGWVQPTRFGTLSRYGIEGGPSGLAAYQALRPSDNEYITDGDSGSPVFLGVGGHLVIHSNVTGGGYIGNDHYSDFITGINAAMNSLATAAGDPAAGTYAVQTVDLSGFTTYTV